LPQQVVALELDVGDHGPPSILVELDAGVAAEQRFLAGGPGAPPPEDRRHHLVVPSSNPRRL
jgi:hypothetical protein